MTGISPKVSSIAGDIHIIGEAGSGFSFGGVLLTRGVVESTATSKADSAKIIVEGTGKGGATGVTIGYRVTVSSETGDINVTGTGDEYGNGVNVRFGAAIESTGTVKAQAAKITILGTGGARAGAGVGIGNSIGYPDTKVASVAGDIQIVGGGAAYWVCQGIPTVLR